tara:strand:- start:677 stop:2578 length:1902 start_codon:yes stop_codon:yes gene_type:complete
MPKTAQAKRGRESANPAVAAALAPEEPPEAEELAPAEETPAQRAKKMFKVKVEEAAPSAKHSGGGMSCVLEGVVMHTKDETVQGAKKLRVSVAVDKIIGTGCKDIVTTGLEGIAFGLPTKHLEASPEEVAKNKWAKGPQILDIGDGVGGEQFLCKANFLGMVMPSFYKPEEGSGGGDKDGAGAKGGKEVDLSQILPGMRVMLSNVSVVYGKTGNALYTNAKRIQPLGQPLGTHECAQRIIKEAMEPAPQAVASLLWSMAAGGFYGKDYAENALQQQVDACRAKWSQMLNGSTAKLEQLALDFSKDESAFGKETTTNLTAHASRLKSMQPMDIATGTTVFPCDLGKDCKTPYSAWLVQQGVRAWEDSTSMCDELFEDASALPNAFVEAKVKDVTFRGSLVQVDFRLFFVFDRQAAIVALEQGDNPIINTTKPAASIKLTKRSACLEMVGTLSNAKFEMACKEVLPVADMAVYANVFPRNLDDSQLDGHFVSTAGIDWRNGVQKVGVQISEQWLIKEMLGGMQGYFFRQPDDIALIEPASGDLKAPTLKRCGIEAITEGAFEFSQLEVPVDKVRVYHVVYDGCAGDVRANKELITSVDAGEAHMSTVLAFAAEADAGLTMQNFLRHKCIIYAVAA